MGSKEDYDAAEKFFKEAIEKWPRFIVIWNRAIKGMATRAQINDANAMLLWLSQNYPVYAEYSDFKMSTTENGNKIEIDPLFDVIFQGANLLNLIRCQKHFVDELNMVSTQLTAHLVHVQRKRRQILEGRIELPLVKVTRIMNRFHSSAIHLKNRRKGKSPFLVSDEYDVQDLLYTFLKLEFDDVRKEEYTPSYVGAASRIDFVLKKEKILVEVKKTGENLKSKQIGDQLTVDVARYEEFPNIDVLVCFIYDPDFLIENPDGLISDLEKLPTKKLKIKIIICPKTTP